ncbi:MAG TPA: pyridoxal phosphate-dependent aminotransferase [Thermoanaerobaculia bacterium]|nr:pyridoxal phosphate-dependent aminotransferase [Thermoanaerobaculia bacterium]
MKGSVYMRWAKEHAAARYNLANSGLLGCRREDLELAPEDLLVNGLNVDGYPPLLAAIGARYGVEPERVVPAAGTSGANALAALALLEPGDEVLLEQPVYEPILGALRLAGARVRRFERRFEDGWRPDPEDVRAALADGRVRLVVLTNPHNPSGVLLDRAEVEEIARLAGEAGALLLVDEVYRDVWFEDAPPSHVHLGPHVLATSSLTKSYGLSGLRCGWVLCGSRELADRLRYTRDAMEAVSSIASESLATAAFRQLDRLEARSRAILEPNLALAQAFLAEHAEWLECVVPRRTMMVFPRLRKEEDTQALHDWLRGRETSIVPGRFFEQPRCFRLGFAVGTEDVAEGLRRVGAGLRR